jgi:hypothetical protein
MNALTSFILETLSVIVPRLRDVQKKIGILNVCFYSIFIVVFEFAFAYLIGIDIFLSSIVKTNLELGITWFTYDILTEIILYGLIIGSFIAQLPFIIWIGKQNKRK